MLDTLKIRVQELQDIELGMKRKFDFYEYMKDEAKVEEKRNQIKNIPVLLEKLNEQKPILTEKSRQLVTQINQISKTMVADSNQTTFNAMNSKLGQYVSTDFVSSDSISKVPLEDFKNNLSRLISLNKYPLEPNASFDRHESQPRYIVPQGVSGNRLGLMVRLQTETMQDSDIKLD